MDSSIRGFSSDEARPMTTTSAADTPLADSIVTERHARLWHDTLASILRQRSAVVGLIILGFLVLVAVFADVISPYDPNQSLLGVQDGVTRRSPPCVHLLGCVADKPEHIFGTDGNFRDIFSRVIHGARTSLTIGL